MLCALLFARGLMVGVAEMLLGILAVVLGSTVIVIDLLLPNVVVKFGRLYSAVIIDDVFTIAFDTVMLVLCMVKVFDDTTLEFDAVMVIVDDAVAVTPRLRDKIVVFETAAVAVLDTNTIFEELISAVRDLRSIVDDVRYELYIVEDVVGAMAVTIKLFVDVELTRLFVIEIGFFTLVFE